jgi:sugar phosphate isomerase/epimerase
MGAAAAAALPPGKNDISLANWSIVQSFRAGKWKLLDMPRILRDVLKINGLEYVNTFFENPTIEYLRKLKRNCEDYGMTSVLVMVDDEGNTASLDKAERMQAAVAHRKWIDIAHYLGCHAIRCNLRGGPKEWQQDKDVAKRGAEVFLDILEYAKGSGLNVLIENHGGASSDPDVLLELMRLVNHPKFGMLVDTGNWNPGVDRYEATRKLIRYGKGMSVKGTWGPNKRADFDMEKLLQVCIDGGYHGWWGIEVGWRRPEGVQATPDEIWENEIKSVLGAKAVVERVVLKKA